MSGMLPVCFVRDPPGLYLETGIPLPPRSIGIFGLAGFCELILGLQSVRGKILSPSGLVVRAYMLLVRDGVSMRTVDFSVKVG